MEHVELADFDFGAAKPGQKGFVRVQLCSTLLTRDISFVGVLCTGRLQSVRGDAACGGQRAAPVAGRPGVCQGLPGQTSGSSRPEEEGVGAGGLARGADQSRLEHEPPCGGVFLCSRQRFGMFRYFCVWQVWPAVPAVRELATKAQARVRNGETDPYVYSDLKK